MKKLKDEILRENSLVIMVIKFHGVMSMTIGMIVMIIVTKELTNQKSLIPFLNFQGM